VCDTRQNGVDGCIWALDGAGLNEQQVRDRTILVPSSEPVLAIVRPAFQEEAPKPNQAVLAITALENDIRMLVQQAAFTIHRDAADLRNLPLSTPLLRKFVVPSGSKGYIRTCLRRAGISIATLFPDLAALAVEIRSNYE
jgi:hypothetical protein